MPSTYLLCAVLRALEWASRLLWAALFVFAACVFIVVGSVAALVEWVVGEQPQPTRRVREARAICDDYLDVIEAERQFINDNRA